MVIVQLIGGLGNQLFQYATGRSLAQRNNAPLKLDITGFKSYALRSYRLGYYNIVEEFATETEIQRLQPRRKWVRRWRNRLLRRFLPPYRWPVFRESSLFVVDPDLFRIQRDVYLIGHWQSEQYFADCTELIRREFTLRQPPDAANQNLLDQIATSNAVSVHIRRGDYVANPAANQFHGTLSSDYYTNAVAYIRERVESPHFFVFSDDIAWVRENMDFLEPCTYVEHNGPAQDYEDLRLMSHCRFHIIANSSFSWWGAWLAAFPTKIVVAPQRWFATAPVDPGSRYPVGWATL